MVYVNVLWPWHSRWPDWSLPCNPPLSMTSTSTSNTKRQPCVTEAIIMINLLESNRIKIIIYNPQGVVTLAYVCHMPVWQPNSPLFRIAWPFGCCQLVHSYLCKNTKCDTKSYEIRCATSMLSLDHEIMAHQCVYLIFYSYKWLAWTNSFQTRSYSIEALESPLFLP